MFYVLINCDGVEVRKSSQMLTLKQMQNLVGVEGETSYIEVASYRSFSDISIAIICDEEFLLKNFEPTCITAERHILHGQCLILGINSEGDDFGLLSKQQVELIKKEARLPANLANI